MSVRSVLTAGAGLLTALALAACSGESADTPGTTAAITTASRTPVSPEPTTPATSEPVVSVSTPSGSTGSAGSREDTIPSPTDPLCGTTSHVDDRYHFMTSGHDFVQLCSATGGDQGALLSYVYEDREITALPVLVDGGRDYALACAFAGPTPVCLVQATVPGGTAGSLIRLTDRGTLEHFEATGPRSTVPMTLSALSDEGAELLLVTGVVLPGGAAGFRTSTVDATSVITTGCGPADVSPPTIPLTGACEGAG